MTVDIRPAQLADIENGAKGLAASLQTGSDLQPRIDIYTHLSELPDWLNRLRDYCRKADATHSKAADWLLDNDYQVKRAILQIKTALPEPFFARLPVAENPAEEHLPRLFKIAQAISTRDGIQITLQNLVHYVGRFQEVTPLSTAELWALPSMLRLANLEILAAAFERLRSDLKPPFQLSRDFDEGNPVDLIARAIVNLSAIHAITWQDFFDRTSLVERTLGSDPSGVYRRMDFATRDRYRKVVEEIADWARMPEIDVAGLAVEMSAAETGDRRRGHVGYWLIGDGRAALESRAGGTPPFAVSLRRALAPFDTAGYALGLLLMALCALAIPVYYLAIHNASTTAWLFGIGLSILPATVLSVSVVHWLITVLVSPRILPAMDFRKGIPADCATAVAVPIIVSNVDEIGGMVELLETRRLANPDRHLRYVLLSDLPDADSEHRPGDGAIEEALITAIRRLNERHGGVDVDPFVLLHRRRRYNPGEGRWMGWERKRGKLEQFNQLVLGSAPDDFPIREGNIDDLHGMRFVITLDADTMLPPGSAAKLAGILAHPLNAAVYDDRVGKVVAGYSILQPRMEILPSVDGETRFSRLYSGDTAIDIYTNAVSDVYQELFGTGIFVGKGIYDVATLQRCLDGRIPENAILSHDLFEGLFCRAALVTNVVLYESFPATYAEYAWRHHRWLRGDWQLLPWLGRRVRMADGTRIDNPLSGLDRWKIIDNLRRSLVPPALLLFFIGGWMILPGSAWLWTLLALAAPGIHILGDLFAGLARALRRGVVGDVVHGLKERGGRWFLAIVFLVSDTVVSVDAIIRTLWRLFVTRRHLIEWRSAAHMASRIARAGPRAAAWRFMWPSSLLSLIIGLDLALYDRATLLPAIPILILWFLAPEIAAWASRPLTSRGETLDAEQTQFLLRVARRTWHYFETFAGPQDNWLPPDNFQEVPSPKIAHRTSPTNIGLFLVSALSAREFGFIGTSDLILRCRNALTSMDRMETYRGHWLNWYDTGSLESLEPRYVSAVDSGNLAVCLVALKQGCLETATRMPVDAALWTGLGCNFDLLLQAVKQLSAWDASRTPEHETAFKSRMEEAAGAPRQWHRIEAELSGRFWPDFERLIGETIRASDDPAPQTLNDIHVWLERFDHHLRAIRRDIDTYTPWLEALESPSAEVADLVGSLSKALDPTAPLNSAAARLESALTLIDAAHAAHSGNEAGADWLARLRQSAERGLNEQVALLDAIHDVATTADVLAFGMDFTFLYDPDVRLFRIGYNVSSGQMDSSHYDLLATEARVASFFAIAKHDVPIEHWYFLGRPITRLRGKPSILSWNGSMFEYLMPPLFLPRKRDTLLGESEATAVEYQRRYARHRGVPWGISESAFSVTDSDGNYQYRAFGAPGLGIRRGLTDDLVIAPYASALALSIWPGAATRNLESLATLGTLGSYGFIDALDFTPDRVPERGGFVPVRNYMAHHQGMTVAAIANVLKDDLVVERVLREKQLRAIDHLLQERIPRGQPTETGRIDETWETTDTPNGVPHLAPWIPSPASTVPQMHTVGNGRMSMRLSAAGGGGLFWEKMALTRWQPDPTGDRYGYWIYVRDVDSGALWSMGRNPTGQVSSDERVIFHQHMVETTRRDHGITARMETTVTPGDDVEIRQVTLTNEENIERTIEFTSYAEVVLAPAVEDERHPAFSKLFVHSTYLPDREGLLFERRSRRPEIYYPVLLHRLVADDPDIRLSAHESDRAKFIGRNGELRHPRGVVLGLSRSTGWTLDPVMALQVRVRLKPMETKTFSFMTIAAATKEEVLETALRYQTLSRDWAFREAARNAAREVARLDINPRHLPELQALSSLLMEPCAAVRRCFETVDENRFGQPDLWRFGISGDLPILAVRINDESEPDVLNLLVRAQQLWRHGGLHADLVILRTGLAGYEEPVRDLVLSILHETQAYGFLGRNGGVHFLSAGHMDHDSRRAVEAAAHVVLDEDDITLTAKLNRVLEGRAPPPRFEPPVPAVHDAIAPLQRPKDLAFDNGYGGFDAEHGTYIIHLEPGATTPAPWCNVLANDDLGSIVSEAGLGFTWAENSGENRLTPWPNDPVIDRPGEVLYLRDDATADIWTVTPAPLGRDAACRIEHGCGYTRWKQNSHALEQEMLAFSPVDDPVRIVRLRLRNPTNGPRRVTATYYAEWVLGALGSVVVPRVVGEYDAAVQAILANNGWNPEFASRIAFLTASHPPSSVSGDRHDFLGKEGRVEAPAALHDRDLGGRFAAGGDPCAAYQVQISLAPGETQDIVFVLGQGADRQGAEALIRRWQAPDQVDPALGAVQAFWQQRFGAVTVETPDPAFDLVINRWLPYQTLSSRIMARAGYYQAGGAFGFRDQLQDMLSLLMSDPGRVRAHILRAARHQFEEGDSLHWWHPPSGRGVRTHFSDDYLWLPYVTAHYIRASGDASILDEDVPFLRGPELQPDQQDLYAHFDRGETAPLYDHCARALDRMMRTGRHGLPLIGTGDWNDGMDRVGVGGRGESVWLAWFQIAIVGAFEDLATKRGETARVAQWRGYAERLKQAIDAHGWDGDWFIRAFDDDGEPWGSHRLEECQIDSIAQSWSVLSGLPTEERMETALDAALHRLVNEKDRLIKLLDPPFDKTLRDPGYIKAYPPGIRENGGQYTHSAAWLGPAFARIGDGDTAWRIFDIINPIRLTGSTADADRFAREPYSVAADISALPSKFGLGGWSWYTGAAGWTWQLGVHGILGIEPVDGAVRIDPKLPKDWGGAAAVLTGANGTIRLTIEDPDHVGSGIAWIRANGRRRRDRTIRFPGENKQLEVVVRLGDAE